MRHWPKPRFLVLGSINYLHYRVIRLRCACVHLSCEHYVLWIRKVHCSICKKPPNVYVLEQINTVCNPHSFPWRSISLSSSLLQLGLPVCHLPSDLRTNYQGAVKSLAQNTSLCILFDGENISFDACLCIYTNISSIIIINRIYEHQNLLSLYFSFLVGLRTYQHPFSLYMF
jgi:hypothetical protein